MNKKRKIKIYRRNGPKHKSTKFSLNSWRFFPPERRIQLDSSAYITDPFVVGNPRLLGRVAEAFLYAGALADGSEYDFVLGCCFYCYWMMKEKMGKKSGRGGRGIEEEKKKKKIRDRRKREDGYLKEGWGKSERARGIKEEKEKIRRNRKDEKVG